MGYRGGRCLRDQHNDGQENRRLETASHIGRILQWWEVMPRWTPKEVSL